MKKILFLDLDKTVRRPKSNGEFIKNPHDQELVPGIEEAIACYPNHVLIGITNQSVVAAGNKNFLDCLHEQYITMGLVPLEAIYFCPDFDGIECYRVFRRENEVRHRRTGFEYRDEISMWQGFCQFPHRGMVEVAISDVGSCTRRDCLFVGDRQESQECANNANIPFMWSSDWRNKCAAALSIGQEGSM